MPIAAAVALLAYFYLTVQVSLRSYFTGDALMNLYSYWMLEPHQWVASAKVLFLDRYRPAAALVYLPVYRLFGFDPVALNITLALIQAANVLLYFRLCLRWVSPATAFLTTGAFAYHAAMAELRFSGGTVYDTLVVFFTLTGATLFTSLLDGRRNWLLGLAFVLNTWAGISAKEHFAAFPAILAAILLFERRWPKGAPMAAIAFAGLAILAAAGWRWSHDDVLLRMSTYRPRWDPKLLLSNLEQYVILSYGVSNRIARVFAGLSILSAAWFLAGREWRVFAGVSLWTAASIAPLLVIDMRGGFVLYLAWAGVALWLSLGLEFLRHHQRIASVLAVFLLWKWYGANSRRESVFTAAYLRDHAVNRNFASASPTLPKHSPDRPLLLVTQCWLADQWDPWFIARLAARSTDIHMDRTRDRAKPPRPLSIYTAVLVFDGRTLSADRLDSPACP